LTDFARNKLARAKSEPYQEEGKAKGLAASLRPTTEEKSGYLMSFSVFDQFHQEVIDQLAMPIR
jgi:hypothetical protein